MESANDENTSSRTIAPLYWTVENGFKVIDSKGRLVADCSPRATSPNLQECRHNAHLASFAPHLVDCLKVLIDYMTESHQAEIDSGHFGDDEEGAKCSYCYAIAQAKSLIETACNG